MLRFEQDAQSFKAAVIYLQERAKQLLRFDMRLTEIHRLNEDNALALFDRNGETYIAIYILLQNRSNGAYANALDSAMKLAQGAKVVTVPDCNIMQYLANKGIPFLVLHPEILDGEDFTEYRIIQKFWKDKYAKRTGVHYMRHVDEGLRVIIEQGGTNRAMRIFALHGLLQECYRDFTVFEETLSDVSPDVIIGAMEYRAIANNHLSYHDPSTIRLSEDDDVNMALIADKVQNRKDFELYHKDLHPRSAELDEYFLRWLSLLGISEKRYEELKVIIEYRSIIRSSNIL
jgi:hypothetical protein